MDDFCERPTVLPREFLLVLARDFSLVLARDFSLGLCPPALSCTCNGGTGPSGPVSTSESTPLKNRLPCRRRRHPGRRATDCEGRRLGRFPVFLRSRTGTGSLAFDFR